jgi:hypothetical protein
MSEVELMMPLCSSYVQDVFRLTKSGNGQKWLMLEVRNQETIEDILHLISIRKAPR